jgi:hypothetical protein
MPPEPRHSQGIHHQRPRHALAHCKADYLSVEKIDHHGKIEPALFGPDIGDVTCPDPVRRSHGEVARQQVRSDWQIMRAVRGGLEPALATGAQAAAFIILRTRSLPARMPRAASSRQTHGQP